MTTPAKLIEQFNENQLSKIDLIRTLIDWEYDASPNLKGWDDLYVLSPNSAPTILAGAFQSGRITSEIYEEIRLGIAQKRLAKEI